MHRLFVAFALFTAFAVATSASLANSRFPSAENVVIGPGSEARILVVSTTFGLVLSTDFGLHWRWICEPALGFDRTWDPTLVLASDSSLVVALPDGLSLAQSDYCQFNRPATDPMREVIDLTGDWQGSTLVAALAPPAGPDGISVSTDRGQSWRDGWSLPGFFIDTVDVAPGHPSRMYASGYAPQGSAPVLYRSDDGGATFAETTRNFHGGYDVWIAGVDAMQPDAIYVRSNEAAGGTYLLRSTDGGSTFAVLTHTVSPMLGFAMSPGGQSMWVSGSGRGEGIFRSEDYGATWQPLGNHFTTICLKFQAGVLFACADYTTDGFALAASIDHGEQFAPILAFDRIDGTTACTPGTPGHDLCTVPWAMIAPTLIRDAGSVAIDAGFLLNDGATTFTDALVFPHDSTQLDSNRLPDGAHMDSGGSEPTVTNGGCGCRAKPRSSMSIATGVVTVLLILTRRRNAPVRRNSNTAMR